MSDRLARAREAPSEKRTFAWCSSTGSHRPARIDCCSQSGASSHVPAAMACRIFKVRRSAPTTRWVACLLDGHNRKAPRSFRTALFRSSASAGVTDVAASIPMGALGSLAPPPSDTTGLRHDTAGSRRGGWMQAGRPVLTVALAPGPPTKNMSIGPLAVVLARLEPSALAPLAVGRLAVAAAAAPRTSAPVAGDAPPTSGIGAAVRSGVDAAENT
mmetsp:Transcript_39076/g.101333  ORF Transcript_39076/g.101333 Transcript_39076/m.101333 type:complete len:215 (-) Transcript_39076:658-1302(-)